MCFIFIKQHNLWIQKNIQSETKKIEVLQHNSHSNINLGSNWFNVYFTVVIHANYKLFLFIKITDDSSYTSVFVTQLLH